MPPTEPAAARNPALLISHDAPEDAGLIGEILSRRGASPTLRLPLKGEPLPEPQEVGCAVVLGGVMSANDEHDPAIRAELRWIERALAAGTPLLGVCLGAQMIARVLGARVAPHPRGVWEIGYREVAPTSEGAALFGPVRRFLQWHREGFEPPPGSIRLASGALFPEQAFRYGEAVFGLQFHPEPPRERLEVWMARHGAELAHDGADPAQIIRRDDDAHRDAVERWLDGFLEGWLTPRRD